MSDGKIYLRPLGFLYGQQAYAGIEDGLALPLAGGAIAFTNVELIQGGPKKSKAYMFSVPALSQAGDPDLRARLDQVIQPRPPFAGLDLSRSSLMGIVNVTPDSFSDGGLYDKTEGAVTHAAELKKDGAAIVDIGGESTRPGSGTVAVEDELARVIPVLEGLKGSGAVISIDTRKGEVARAAAKAGAKILNDVSAFTHDPDSMQVAVDTGLDVVLMHAQGEPKTMQDNPTYDDLISEILNFLKDAITRAVKAGIRKDLIIVDPGIGFGKTFDDNLKIIKELSK